VLICLAPKAFENLKIFDPSGAFSRHKSGFALEWFAVMWRSAIKLRCLQNEKRVKLITAEKTSTREKHPHARLFFCV
jgi:hypothetical protein